MAKRPVFEVSDTAACFSRKEIEFTYFSGFAAVQKQRSSKSLRDAYTAANPGKKVLEISSYSESLLGNELSAFHLMIRHNENLTYSVESAFQAGKIFEQGGPYRDLLLQTPGEAKKDPRLVNSGKLIGFAFGNLQFPKEPKTYFYDWLYVNALNQHPEYHQELLQYDAFTDIVFNPRRQINCQAEAAAIFVSLCRRGKLEEALKNKASFRKVVFGQEEEEQITLFL